MRDTYQNVKFLSKILAMIFVAAFIINIQPLHIHALGESCETDADCPGENDECVDGECQMVVTASSTKAEIREELGVSADPAQGTAAIGEYIKEIYNFAIGIVGIVAALAILAGGVRWITAGGNTNRIESAKSWITAALTGLVIALSSYAILYTVNPDLVEFRTINPVDLEEKDLSEYDRPGCCSWAMGCKENMYKEECDEKTNSNFYPGPSYECGDPSGTTGNQDCEKK